MKQLVVVLGATAVAEDRVVIIVQVNASGSVSTTSASALRQLPVLEHKRLDLTGLAQTSDADWQQAKDREKAVQQLQASAALKLRLDALQTLWACLRARCFAGWRPIAKPHRLLHCCQPERGHRRVQVD
jgi:hypothetical protein